MRQYADSVLCLGAPSHTLALVFSGQSDAVLGSSSSSSSTPGSKPLFVGANPVAAAAPAPAPAAAPASSRDTTLLLTQWRSNLASLIANRPKGWRKLASELGDALLLSENAHGSTDGATAAAHCCYVVSGEPPIGVRGKCDRGLGMPPSPTNPSDGGSMASAGSVHGARALQRAQALEWCLVQTHPQPPPHALAQFQLCKLDYAQVVLQYARNGNQFSSNLGPASMSDQGTGAITPLTEQASGYAKALRTSVDSISAAQGGAGAGTGGNALQPGSKNSVFEAAFLNNLAAFESEVAPHHQGGNGNQPGGSNSSDPQGPNNGSSGGSGFFSRVGSGILGSLEKLSQAEEEEQAATQLAADNAAAAAAAAGGSNGPFPGGNAIPSGPGPTFGSSSASFGSGVQRPTPIATSSSGAAFPAYSGNRQNNTSGEIMPPPQPLMSSSSDGAVAANGGFNNNDFGFGDTSFGDGGFGDSSTSGSMMQPPQPRQMHEPGSPSIFERSKSTPNDLGKVAAAALPDTPTGGGPNANNSSNSGGAFGRSSSTGGSGDGASTTSSSSSISGNAKASGGASNSKIGADVTAKKGWLATKVIV